jgi:DNA repair protein RadD
VGGEDSAEEGVNDLRPYQRKTVDAVRSHWSSRTRSVCVVAPTGAGKTRMGEELLGDETAVWCAHRRELITQTAKRLRTRLGKANVGIVMPGEYANPNARVQVATVQTLLARGERPRATVLVLDEAHHYAADDWRQLVSAYPKARTLGLTATPERRDGEPLGDIFGELVVSASYSELVAGGFLVPARVHRPATSLGNDLAQDPVSAWHAYSEGSRAFLFCGRVADAHAWAKKFRDAGVRAAVIEASTAKAEREETLSLFARGVVRVVVNVNTMTEGIDVPEARTIILARAFGHVGGYLQVAGRGLRPAKDKAGHDSHRPRGGFGASRAADGRSGVLARWPADLWRRAAARRGRTRGVVAGGQGRGAASGGERGAAGGDGAGGGAGAAGRRGEAARGARSTEFFGDT